MAEAEVVVGDETGSTACPECGAQMPSHVGFVTWCNRCGWNTDPARPETDDSKISAFRRKLATRYGEQLYQQILSGTSLRVRISPAGIAAFAIATLIHSVTVVMIAGGLTLIVTSSGSILPIVSGLLLLGCSVPFWPRFGKLSENLPTLERENAPRLFTLLDEIATAVGSKKASVIQVSAVANAAALAACVAS